MITTFGGRHGQARPKKSLKFRLLKISVYAALVLFLVALFFVTSLRKATEKGMVIGESMSPTLEDGDVLLQLLAPFKIERGDIIVFQPPDKEKLPYVKRVVGLPGETISVAPGGYVYVNGKFLTEPYVKFIGGANPKKKTTTLAAGCYFVMGDNRANSYDSRDFGPVCGNILEKALLFLAPEEKAMTTPYKSRPFFLNQAGH